MDEKEKTPAIRFKDFTNAWEQVKLGQIAEKVTDKNTEMKFYETFTNSAEQGIISQRDFFDHDIAKQDRIDRYYIVKNNDFVYNPRISVTAPVGPINRNKLGRNGVMSPLYCVFRTNEIDHTFLEYFFKSSHWHSFMYFNGDSGARSDRFSIKDSVFFEMHIPYPNFKEQNLIGVFLSKLDSLITLHQRKYEKLCSVKKSMLDKMFPKDGENAPEIRLCGFTETWKQVKLGNITQSYSGGTPSVGVKEYYNGTIPFIRSAEINKNHTELFLSTLGLDNSSARMVNQGDILYALYGATSGEVGRAQLNGAINQAILAIIPNPEFDADFIVQWLRKSKKQIIDTYLQGGQGNLSATLVKDLIIDLPNFKEQVQIGQFFSKFDSLITFEQHQIEKLKNMKKSMLDKMFV